MPSLPSSVMGTINGSFNESSGIGVVRQPRGPGSIAFGRRATNTEARGSGLEARTHEPLEI